MTPVAAPHPAPTARTQGLWSRLRRTFALPAREEPAIDARLRRYRTRPESLAQVETRARRYLHYIVDAVESRDLPGELALVPMVESELDPHAYSAGGAAGLWQFIPSTGRHYGLEQNWWQDQRRDVIASTTAALDYLEYLHALFDDDWLLALAAYNAGLGNVRDAIRANRRDGKPTGFFKLDLPQETRAYVPKLLALRRLIAEPEAYGVALPPVANEPYFETVQLDGQLSLARAATLAEVDLDALYQLNPALNRWATPPQGPHRLVLPRDAVTRLTQALASRPGTERGVWRRHEIERGDTLSELAQRFDLPMDILRRANQLEGDVLQIGEALLVPPASASGPPLQFHDAGVRDDARREVRYQVQAGDSLWAIARAHGVGIEQLAAWNGMGSNQVLRADQTLVLWPRGQRSHSESQEHTKRRLRYPVQAGDSLWAIASRFGVSVEALLRWNELDRQDLLRPGQPLTLFIDAP